MLTATQAGAHALTNLTVMHCTHCATACADVMVRARTLTPQHGHTHLLVGMRMPHATNASVHPPCINIATKPPPSEPIGGCPDAPATVMPGSGFPFRPPANS